MPSPLDLYRSTGADLPFGDPLPAHGVASEGYFWRFSHAETGRSLTTSIGVNRTGEHTWSAVTFAAHPNGVIRTKVSDGGVADPQVLGASVGTLFSGDNDRVQADLGAGAQLDARITDHRLWPRRAFGGASFFQSVPGVAQRWHPWLFGGTVTGTARVGDETWDLADFEVYAEKRWGSGGLPGSWWCGQAQGFGDESCVAFAGGTFTTGRLRIETTLVVVRLPDGEVLRFGGPSTSHVRAKAGPDKMSLHGRNPRSGIEIEGSSVLDSAFVLPAPDATAGTHEAATITHFGGHLNVTVRRRADILWHGESALAAMEYGESTAVAAELARRRRTGSVAAPPLD